MQLSKAALNDLSRSRSTLSLIFIHPTSTNRLPPHLSNPFLPLPHSFLCSFLCCIQFTSLSKTEEECV